MTRPTPDKIEINFGKPPENLTEIQMEKWLVKRMEEGFAKLGIFKDTKKPTRKKRNGNRSKRKRP